MKGPANEVSVSVLDEPRPPWVAAFRRFCLSLLRAAGIAGAEVSVVLTGDRRMRQLNERYRGVDRTTDVLSFAQSTDPISAPAGALGDIVISLPALARNARRYGVPIAEEIKRLTVHGLLHLMGCDHRSDGERRSMTARQEALVRELDDVKVTT